MSNDKVLAEAAAAVTAMQAQAATLMQNIDASLAAIRALERRVKAVVDEQAHDVRIWAIPNTTGPDGLAVAQQHASYVLLALRRLHAAVTGETLPAPGEKRPCPKCGKPALVFTSAPGITVYGCAACSPDPDQVQLYEEYDRGHPNAPKVPPLRSVRSTIPED